MANTINPLASPDLSDIAEDDTVEATTEASTPPPELDLSDAQKIPTSDLQASAKGDEDKARQAAEDRAAFEKNKRLNRIRGDKALLDCRLRFVLESAGIERFQQNYNLPGGFAHVVFHTISNDDMVAVANQAPRDIQQGRWNYDVEGQTLMTWYRLCCSVRSFKLSDPIHKHILRSFERGEWQERFSKAVPDPKKPTIDLLPRQLYTHMMDEVFPTKTLAMTIYNLFMSFENMMNDLAFLLEHDPDFFYAGLTST